MKKLFEVTSKYSVEDIEKLSDFTYSKIMNKSLKWFYIFLTLSTLFFVVAEAYEMVIFTVFLYLFPYAGKRYMKYSAVKEYKSLVLFELEHTFTFYKDHMTIKTKQDDSKLFYNQFYSIDETDEYFYLYLSKKRILVIKKEQMDDKFSAFIKDKIK